MHDERKLNGILLKERKKKKTKHLMLLARHEINEKIFLYADLLWCIVHPTEQVCAFIYKYGFTFALFMRGIDDIAHEQRGTKTSCLLLF